MIELFAIILSLLVVSGLVSEHSRRSTERCRRYLATIARWQPGALIDGTAPKTQTAEPTHL